MNNEKWQKNIVVIENHPKTVRLNYLALKDISHTRFIILAADFPYQECTKLKADIPFLEVKYVQNFPMRY